jgi:hypothetical protein
MLVSVYSWESVVATGFCLMLPDSLNKLFREAGEEEVHALGAERDRGRRVGDDKPFESLRGAGGGILGCQHTWRSYLNYR